MDKLLVEYGEVVSSQMNLAIVYWMLPAEMQEISRVLDRCSVQWDQVRDDEIDKKVKSIVEDVKNVAKTRRDQATPAPIDVGAVSAEGAVEAGHGEEEQGDGWPEYEINAIGKGYGTGWKWGGN